MSMSEIRSLFQCFKFTFNLCLITKDIGKILFTQYLLFQICRYWLLILQFNFLTFDWFNKNIWIRLLILYSVVSRLFTIFNIMTSIFHYGQSRRFKWQCYIKVLYIRKRSLYVIMQHFVQPFCTLGLRYIV